MSMDNKDIVGEISSHRGEESPRNVILQITEPTNEVQEHDRYLSKEHYDSIKCNRSASHWRMIGDDIILRKSPMRNTILHIAALYKNDICVEEVVQKAPLLLDAINGNGDTALHVAARTGHVPTLEKLLAACLHNLAHPYFEKPKEALDKILVKNKQGNTFFHEALLNNHKGVMGILHSEKIPIEAAFVELVERAALFCINNEEKSVSNLAIEKGLEDIVDDALNKLTSQHPALDNLIHNNQELAKMILPNLPEQDKGKLEEKKKKSKIVPYTILTDMEMDKYWHKYPKQLVLNNHHVVLQAKSPLIVATLEKNKGILQKILNKKKEWIHLRDKKGMTAIHYAASIGYLHGVEKLLGTCIYCNMEKDDNGFFPLHLATAGGHVEVVKKLLEQCPDPREILDNYGRNIVHIAAKMGKFNVIRYILQDTNHGLVDMINDKDEKGNTPLHLAASQHHPKIVHALTWNKNVRFNLVNKMNQTALDVCMSNAQENPPLRQRLTWIALKSAGAQSGERQTHTVGYRNMDQYKDRINTLMLVSTLITTVTFAAGFTLPGGTNSSNPRQGMAVMLNHIWFKLFIFCITISMYGAISVTLILIWAQLGDITLALLALKVATPLLGVTLATLSGAFLAGVHLVISDLSWLATAFLVLCVIFILMLLLLYTILWFPSSSSNPVVRYISYYPFQFQAWLVEKDETEDM